MGISRGKLLSLFILVLASLMLVIPVAAESKDTSYDAYIKAKQLGTKNETEMVCIDNSGSKGKISPKTSSENDCGKASLYAVADGLRWSVHPIYTAGFYVDGEIDIYDMETDKLVKTYNVYGSGTTKAEGVFPYCGTKGRQYYAIFSGRVYLGNAHVCAIVNPSTTYIKK